MRWLKTMGETIRTGLRSWLQLDAASPVQIHIKENMDFEANAIRNRIWYRGDSNELTQLYGIVRDWADQYKFWACKSTPGMEIRKLHTGLPGIIVRTLCSVILPDMLEPDFKRLEDGDLWRRIAQENDMSKLLTSVLKDCLVVGDGAVKVTFDTQVSACPLLAWYPGDQCDYVYERGRLKEIVFKTPYKAGGKQYILYERYAYGAVSYDLTLDGKSVPLSALPETEALVPVHFDPMYLLAVPIRIYESAKYAGRGASIFDGKIDDFDALDEVWSQWMDAVRAGRAKTYIPDAFIPRDPETGRIRRPNSFDDRYILTDTDMAEKVGAKISTEQSAIPHESYVASYITALDLCLQGIISPSTLGIDTKKLDNAEAQREKEKTTLYTRNSIVTALSAFVQELIGTALNAQRLLEGSAPEDIAVEVGFGEYANPSFESQIETLSKGRQGGIMSLEACVDELYGDTKSAEWKAEEVARLKAEQGVAMNEETALNMDLEGLVDAG